MITLTEILSQHPDAVFVRRTALTSFEDREGFRQGGYDVAGDLFVASEDASDGRTFVLKPNVVAPPFSDPQTGELRCAAAGIVTNPHFVGGIADRLREMGASRVVIAEGGGRKMAPVFESRGYAAVAEARGVPLVDLFRDWGACTEEELNWTKVEGVIFREIPYVRPINDPGTVLINVPTLKTHNLAIVSLCVKNLQGTIALECRKFCHVQIQDERDRFQGTARCYRPDFKARMDDFRQRNLQTDWEGRDKLDEVYVHRACDSLLGLPRSVHIIEGIVGRDGTGFDHGRDTLTNLILAGTNPVHVDAVAAYLMGHDPRNIPYLHMACIRGFGRCDPEEIEVYLTQDGGMERCERLTEIGRLSLGVYHRGDTSKYVFF